MRIQFLLAHQMRLQFLLAHQMRLQFLLAHLQNYYVDVEVVDGSSGIHPR